MNRRRMLASMAGASLLVGTQGLANDRIRRIGMLNLTTPGNSRVAEDFSTVLRELGWIEGKNLALDLRTAPGDAALQRQYAAELVRMNVDVIMTLGYDATMAARDATKRIPIVMNISVDPVKAGLVTSLGRPGGNITGVWFTNSEVTSKRLAVLHEALPAVRRVAILRNSRDPIEPGEQAETLRRLGLEPLLVLAATSEEIENRVTEAARSGAQALVVYPSWLFWENWESILRLANQFKLPVVGFDPSQIEHGALMSFAVDSEENIRMRALQVDRILRGTRPADLPVQQPAKYVLSINLRTAKVLGVAIPQSVLLRADEVIR